MTAAPALWIKICGLRTLEAIAAAVDAGADAVGFVFHEPSPRHLALEEAATLAGHVPAHVEKVAVFLQPERALFDAAIQAVRPQWVQADRDALSSLRPPAHVRSLCVVRDADEAAFDPGGSRFLFEGASSGAGQLANWSQAARLARAGELVLAGGLHAGNVADAIAAVRPFGIDVSSGVESTRGVKDVALIHEFVHAARAQQARLASSSLE